jgi:hypothetical protein
LTHQTDEKMELTYETCKAAAAYYESRGFVTEIFAAPFEGYKLGIEFRDPHGNMIFVWVDSYEIEEIEQKTK